MSTIEYVSWCCLVAGLFCLGSQSLDTQAGVKLVEPNTELISYRDSDQQKITSCKTNKECNTVAQSVFFESRGESKAGKLAVAHVVMNRVGSDKFPNTVSGVVYAKRNGVCQFEYTCLFNYAQRQKMLAKDTQSWHSSLVTAYDVYYGGAKDKTNGADHYLNISKVKRVPKFAKEYQMVAMIGDHTFYRR